MIANSSNLQPEEEPDKPDGSVQQIGGQPVVDPRTGGKDMRLLRRAIREDWPITPEIRRLIVNQMALTAGRSEDERNRIAAAKVLVAADSINARREATDMQAEKMPPSPVTVNVGAGGQVSIGDVVRHMQNNDPGIIDAMEHKRFIESGPVGGKGIAGPMANGSPPYPAQPGTPKGGPGAN